MTTTQKRKPDPLNVQSIEDIIYLLKEWDEDYQKNGGINAKDAYVQWLDYINNLWK